MVQRPRTAFVKKLKARRCPKCNTLIGNQRVRCKKCAGKVPRPTK